MADTIKATVFRYNPSVDAEPRYVTYDVPRLHPQMSVLQVLRYIHDEIEPISFEYTCRSISCGTCGITLNGTPGLACSLPVTDECTIEPLQGFRVIKDLVVDRTEVNERLHGTIPWFSPLQPMTEPQSMPVQNYIDTSNLQLCKDCLSCMTVCPQVKALGSSQYAGPYIMMKIAMRYYDTREDNADMRLRTAVREGLFNCIECGMCHEVCPRGKIMEVDGYPNAALDHLRFIREMKAAAEEKGYKPASTR